MNSEWPPALRLKSWLVMPRNRLSLLNDNTSPTIGRNTTSFVISSDLTERCTIGMPHGLQYRSKFARLSPVLLVSTAQRTIRSTKPPRKAKEPAKSSGPPPRGSPPGDMPAAVAPAERHIETPTSAKGVEILPARERFEKELRP
jgi:hypothetical protein